MIVHSLNSRRRVVEKDLITSKEGVYLKYQGRDILIEKDRDIWLALCGKKLRSNIVNMINLTSNCNLNCSYCYFKKLRSGWGSFEMDLKQAKIAVSMVKDVSDYVGNMNIKDVLLSDKNFPKIRLSGGEPTIWEPLPKLLSHIVENKNNSISILSNGVNLSSKDYIRKVPPVPQITWAITARDTSKITCKAIENIIENGNQLVFNLVYNPDTVRELTDFCVKWKPHMIRYRVLVDYPTGVVSGYQSDMINFICGYFGISKAFYLYNCISTSPYITCLPYYQINQDFSICTILTPTWDIIVLEEAIKSRTFLFSGKTHRYDTLLIETMNDSSEFRKWRIKQSSEEII